MPPLRILTFTTLFPNRGQPNHGVFVWNRLSHLVRTQDVEATVVAPVPWFPSSAPVFGPYAAYAQAERETVRDGVKVYHPRYFLPPKVGMSAAPDLIFHAAAPFIERLVRGGLSFDLIDAHFFYPDGLAALKLGKRFDVPVCVTARGTDVNHYPDTYPHIRKRIISGIEAADGVITVSNRLKDDIAALGVAPDKVTTLRNGVDLDAFRPPADREALRAKLSFTRRTLLCVGHLIERKGQHIAIEALPKMPDTDLALAGDGPDRAGLEAQAERLGVADRVRFLGRVPHNELKDYYGAADALVLASSREGWANVLLEAMACGTPVITAKAGSAEELVSKPEAGVVMEDRTADALVRGAEKLFAAPSDRPATRAYAEKFSWDETSRGQVALFQDILARRGRPSLTA